MSSVSWRTGVTELPTPDCSIVDGSAHARLATVAATGWIGHCPRVQLALDDRSEPQFRRFDQSMRIVRRLAPVLLLAAVSLAVSTLTMPRSAATMLSGAVMAIVALTLAFVQLRAFQSKPAQYPEVRNGWVVVHNVHPEAARRWKAVAGDLITTRS